jgi:hypothetical protein
MFLQKRQRLPEDIRVLKPEIWFELEGKLFNCCGYNTLRNKTRYNVYIDGEEESFEELSILEVKKMDKERKYRKLVEDCENIFDIKVHFFVIIVPF